VINYDLSSDSNALWIKGPMTAPAIGATQKSHSCWIAQPPAVEKSTFPVAIKESAKTLVKIGIQRTAGTTLFKDYFDISGFIL
jgi:hypothetical protein